MTDIKENNSREIHQTSSVESSSDKEPSKQFLSCGARVVTHHIPDVSTVDIKITVKA
jgi:hypothetical protein